MTQDYVLRRRLRRKRRRHGAVLPTGLVLLFIPLAVTLSIVGCSALAGMRYVDHLSADYVSAEEAIAARGGGARIHDRNGTMLFQFLDEGYGQQERIALSEMGFWIQAATIATEDASFFSNPGISVQGLARAMRENIEPGGGFLEGSGGSSITQQLVKQIYFTPEERERRSLDRKAKEVVFAIRMTKEYDKEQILEWYLNEIPYGNLAMGIESASLTYFGIHTKDLSLAQAAFLAGLPQSPSRWDPFSDFDAAKRRQTEVLSLMERHGAIDSETRTWAQLETITLNRQPRPFLAPHFVLYVADYLKATLGEEALYHGGIDVLTTLDLPLNDMANAYLEESLLQHEESSNGHNGSVVVIQPNTGQILAMVGSRDYFREDVDGEVNNAVALNSPGSTLKPFTYATAFKQGWGPEWPIIDSVITYKEVDGKEFKPRNPDGRNRGTITVKQALGNSFNIPAFKTILWVGVDNVRATAKSMGITTLDREGLGPALTLGGVDVKLLDMTYAYSTFANNGVMAGVPSIQALPAGNRRLEPTSVLLVKNRSGEILMDNMVPQLEVAIDPEYAYMITDILSKDENRQITYGRGSNLNITGHRVAVKTGTSEPYDQEDEKKKKLIGDTWTIGYTPEFAVGVWVGNSDNTPMVNIFSTTIAGNTWHNVMTKALEGKPARDWVKPAGIVEATVCVPSGAIVHKDTRCRSVKGDFALSALGQQTAEWWGGELLPRARTEKDLSTAPPELSEWRAYLAKEYLRVYGGGSGGGSQRPQAPAAAPPPSDAPAAGNPAPAPRPAEPPEPAPLPERDASEPEPRPTVNYNNLLR
jgi:membrane peptidoglycan carboxypeptidase